MYNSFFSGESTKWGFYLLFNPYYSSSGVATRMSMNVSILPNFFSVSLFQSFTSAIFLIPKRGFICLFYNISLNVKLNKQQKNIIRGASVFHLFFFLMTEVSLRGGKKIWMQCCVVLMKLLFSFYS
jgi:hypothetical protein